MTLSILKTPLNKTLFSFSQESCESGCVLPTSLSIQVLWARRGLLDLPQNYILGAKYSFRCEKHKVGKAIDSVRDSVQMIQPRANTPNPLLLRLFLSLCCQCSSAPSVTVTTEVTFVDTTVYPDAPRGAPQPQWKFPFGFFTRGAAELDGHTVLSSGGSAKVTWSLMLFTVMLLTGLEFFTR